MLDSYIRQHIDQPLNTIALVIAKTGVSANMLTASGLSFLFVPLQPFLFSLTIWLSCLSF